MSDPRFKILFVCNGDNARGPLAAACTTSLVATGRNGIIWDVDSAGTETLIGGSMRSEATRAAGLLGLEIGEHIPSLLTAERCEDPDLILAMSWEQVSHIWSLVPQAWDKVFTVKEFVHWAQRAPTRPPILFADRGEQMRDKVVQAHGVRKRARADFGFWGGIRPQDLNLIEPNGKGDEAWATLAKAVHALASDVITLLRGPELTVVDTSQSHSRHPRSRARASRTARPGGAAAKTKARR
jgi:protein-tyrosine-phosphatase